jgi:GR25 family glycosyltransferase involved in LPS biosynthesis
MQSKNSQQILSAMTSFLINLEQRPDPMTSAIEEARKLKLNLVRVDAVEANSPNLGESLLTPSATACWESHKKALRIFLETEMQHCLVLEDDFLVTSVSGVLDSLGQVSLCDWDFIQIGFLNTGFRDRVSRILTDLETSIFRLLSDLAHLPLFRKRNLTSRLRIVRVQGVPSRFIPDDIRSGAHAYIVSRNLAQILLSLNQPAFLTADGLYSALAWDKKFKMIRVRRSYIKQSDSPSSIKVPKLRQNE